MKQCSIIDIFRLWREEGNEGEREGRGEEALSPLPPSLSLPSLSGGGGRKIENNHITNHHQPNCSNMQRHIKLLLGRNGTKSISTIKIFIAVNILSSFENNPLVVIMAWISKKAKKQMRDRRKKNQESSHKRKRDEGGEDEIDSSKNWEVVQKETIHTVTIPSSLSTKDARKMRKEARRAARKEGRDESKIKFVDENGTTLTINENSKKGTTNEGNEEAATKETELKPAIKKRKTRSFPNINKLLEEADEAKKLQEEKEKREAYENSIPEEVKSSYIALDCEMVGVGIDGKESALARVSITGWDNDVILDTFVQVPDRVTDFRTHVSGVRAKDIRSTNENAMELQTCRKKVGQLLKNKILVGHSLKNDFAALMLDHPKSQIRDTARYKPFMRASGRNGGKLRPRKLRDLVKDHLNLTIQKEGEAHTSVEDAQATMKLYKAVRETWEKELEKKKATSIGRGR